MGASNSSHHHHHRGHHGSVGASSSSDVLRSAQSWSSLQEAETASCGMASSVSTIKSETVKKKRNLGSLGTLTKRLVRKARRASKSFDHSQIIRDFLSGWSTRDLLQLVEEYESTGLLKELTLQAEVARPTAASVSHDLSQLFDYKNVADTYLLFRGHHFPVHKSIG